jgi:uncharacterized coiled-coil protein SlyX
MKPTARRMAKQSIAIVNNQGDVIEALRAAVLEMGHNLKALHEHVRELDARLEALEAPRVTVYAMSDTPSYIPRP